MLQHPTSSAFTYKGPTPILGACLVRQKDVLRDGRGVWWRYTLAGADDARMIRLRLGPEPVWISVSECGDDTP